MKRIAAVILLLMTVNGYTQTDLYIIGSVHFPTAKINSDSIYQVLENISPELILLELDSTLMDKSGQFRKEFEPTNEITAARKFKQRFSGCKLRRFDFEGRNTYYATHETFRTEQRIGQVLDSLSSASASEQHRQDIQSLFQVNAIMNRQNQGTLQEINSLPHSGLIAFRQYWLYERMQEILQTEQLSELAEAWREVGRFWGFRNAEMAKNIRKLIAHEKPARAVVLVGVSHKYALREGLLQMPPGTDKIIVKDFWQQ